MSWMGVAGKTLAEGGGGKLGLAELIRRPEHALLLAGQLDAGGARYKPKSSQYSRNFSSPSGLADLDEGRVAGVHHGPAQGLGAVAASGGAADVPVSAMWTLPVQTKVLLSVMVPSSRPAATTMGLKVEPGS